MEIFVSRELTLFHKETGCWGRLEARGRPQSARQGVPDLQTTDKHGSIWSAEGLHGHFFTLKTAAEKVGLDSQKLVWAVLTR